MGYLDPPDPPDYPCAICGLMPDKCQCPECPTCSTNGCLEHIKFQALVGRMLLLGYQFSEYEKEYAKRPEGKCAKHGPINPHDGCCWGCVEDLEKEHREAAAEWHAEHKLPPGV